VRERRLRPPGPVDLTLTLGRLRRAGRDPCLRLGARAACRATRTAAGPATLALEIRGPEVLASAWGPGADAVLDQTPALLGFDDDPAAFTPGPGVVRDLHRRAPGLRLGRTGAAVEALVPAVLEQRVTGVESARSYRSLVRRHGEPAPGPFGLLLPPDPALLAALPYWALHRCGIEQRRADTIRRGAARAARLETATALAPADAARLLTAVPGVGPWTAAEVAQIALGDRDSVSVGDYNLSHLVGWALAGERRATDERMLELLAPYSGHRARVVRLLELSGRHPPRRAPRAPLRSLADC
jgi:3-methyladenine DNA glycosylase/8-oxoguanine DNA glycosylase